MKSEMDLLKMDSQNRLCWLRANRITLIVVGLVWIGIIVAQALTGNISWFMIAMVPVFATLRFVSYLVLRRQN